MGLCSQPLFSFKSPRQLAEPSCASTTEDDIYSLGVLGAELVTAQPLFSALTVPNYSPSTHLEQLQALQDTLLSANTGLQTLLWQCLNVVEAKRPTSEECVQLLRVMRERVAN